MKWKLGVTAAAAAMLLAGSSQAAIVTSMTSTAFDQTPGIDHDDATFNFNGSSPLSNSYGTFSGSGQLRTGTQGDSAAPAGDTSQYLSVLANTSETLVPTHGISEMQIYVGSIDDYNSFTFYTGSSSETFSGSQLLADAVPSLAPAAGNQTNGDNNRYFDIHFSEPVTKVVFGSSQNSLEFDNVNLVGGVPEPSTWISMIFGFGMLGGLVRFASRATRAIQAV